MVSQNNPCVGNLKKSKLSASKGPINLSSSNVPSSRAQAAVNEKKVRTAITVHKNINRLILNPLMYFA